MANFSPGGGGAATGGGAEGAAETGATTGGGEIGGPPANVSAATLVLSLSAGEGAAATALAGGGGICGGGGAAIAGIGGARAAGGEAWAGAVGAGSAASLGLIRNFGAASGAGGNSGGGDRGAGEGGGVTGAAAAVVASGRRRGFRRIGGGSGSLLIAITLEILRHRCELKNARLRERARSPLTDRRFNPIPGFMPQKNAQSSRRSDARTSHLLARHFKGYRFTDLVTAARRYPVTLRVDLQRIFEAIVQAAADPGVVLGIHSRLSAHMTLTFSELLREGERAEATVTGPMQFDDLDIGELAPARCVRSALWLHRAGKTPLALLLVQSMEHGRGNGVQLEIAVPAGEVGKRLADELAQAFERQLAGSRSYAGKVLSLDAADNYTGRVGSVRVHRLNAVGRDDLILPTETVELLERNIVRFAAQRPALARAGLPQKKGVLFYGPPGTGKTHTIHYLAQQLPDHAMLIVTGAGVVDLADYFLLARFLQPAIVVLEDVDLIARQRTQMRAPGEEVILNKLLNEMDGLQEDAAIFFILTTNAPEQLEAALASRPGRIDQAIEFPLPDENARRRLARLYAKGLVLTDELVAHIARRTERASASLIKELMRRAQQFALERASQIGQPEVDAALHEMVMAGGSLNRRLLGFAESTPVAGRDKT